MKKWFRVKDVSTHLYTKAIDFMSISHPFPAIHRNVVRANGSYIEKTSKMPGLSIMYKIKYSLKTLL
jgi:hypothetical protein